MGSPWWWACAGGPGPWWWRELPLAAKPASWGRTEHRLTGRGLLGRSRTGPSLCKMETLPAGIHAPQRQRGQRPRDFLRLPFSKHGLSARTSSPARGDTSCSPRGNAGAQLRGWVAWARLGSIPTKRDVAKVSWALPMCPGLLRSPHARDSGLGVKWAGHSFFAASLFVRQLRGDAMCRCVSRWVLLGRPSVPGGSRPTHPSLPTPCPGRSPSPLSRTLSSVRRPRPTSAAPAGLCRRT